jgi:hypothetical protein
MRLVILLILLSGIKWAVAGIPKTYTGQSPVCGHHELEKMLRNVIDERLAKFHTNFYKDVAEWMSYLENFATSKFSEHYLSIADELKQHRHHNRAVLNDIKSSCVHKREIVPNDYSNAPPSVANAMIPNKARDLMAAAETFRRRFFTESTTKTTEPTTIGSSTTTTDKPSVTDKTPNGAEFVASDYDDFGESIPFFSSTESTTAAVLRSPFPRNATAEELAERAIMEGFRKLWNIA